jgi:hypothetical protein
MVLMIGCDGKESDGNVVLDSAGIRIVENRQPAWSDGSAWLLDSAPTVEIGGRESLSQIGRTLRLPDGRIVVVHGGGSEILVYSPQGQLDARFGRRGSGPGEFQEIARLFVVGGGDSIMVYDYSQNRLSIFDTRGSLGRTEHASPDGTPAFIEARFDDGSFLVATPTPPTLEVRGLVRPPRILWRRTADGHSQQLVQIPGTEMFYQEMPNGQVDFRTPFFGHTSHYAVWRDRLVWAATDAFRIHVHASDGTPLLLIDREIAGRKVTSADVEPLIEKQVMTVKDEDSRPVVRRLLHNMPTSTVPALGAAAGNGPALLVDDEGNIWVAEYTLPGNVRNSRIVFDSGGAWLGSVLFPPGFAPAQIGADYVLGKARDSLDVEHVRLYTLRKPR